MKWALLAVAALVLVGRQGRTVASPSANFGPGYLSNDLYLQACGPIAEAWDEAHDLPQANVRVGQARRQ